ncbi:MAG: hypothetical protein LUO98_00625 [Methanoregula sp.]|nr:hypothetical protein [Methanoregula sp.]
MMNGTVRRTGNDGVSESIGFILIFAMVIVGIGLVTLYGYPLLLKQQTNADEQIMEKNMIVLQNDMKSLAYKSVPYKETSMKIGGGALTVNRDSSNGPKFRIYSGGIDYLPDNRTGSLSYRSLSTQEEISLQNGAVMKRALQSSGSTTLAEPRWFYDRQTETLVINVIRINSSVLMAREGISTVQMMLGETDYISTAIANPVFVDYTPFPDTTQDYHIAWQNYLTRAMNMDCSWSSPTLTCWTRDPVSLLVIKKTDVVIRSV